MHEWVRNNVGTAVKRRAGRLSRKQVGARLHPKKPAMNKQQMKIQKQTLSKKRRNLWPKEPKLMTQLGELCPMR